jgi:Zn-dependent protease with chaperone function
MSKIIQRRLQAFLRAVAATIVIGLIAGCASTTNTGAVGVVRKQMLLVPAEVVDSAALTSFNQQNQAAQSQKRLVTSGEEYRRIVEVAMRLKNQVSVFRPDAVNWKWQVALIDSPVENATCAAGGKITFYTGLIRKLHLTNDEIAAVMGHEIAHALREHSRERMSQDLGVKVASMIVSANSPENAQLAGMAGKYLFVLPNSREHESEADRMGIELAARAGYDPNAAVNVWRKMIALEQGKRSPEFLSTHPSHENRIQSLEATVPLVMPLYIAARGKR